MKRASQVAATIGLLLALGAVVLMVRDGMFDVEGLWGLIIAAFPVTLATLGLRFASSNRPGPLWIVAGTLGLFVTITAFSVGPYFWATTGSALLAALLLELARRFDRSSRSVETPNG